MEGHGFSLRRDKVLSFSVSKTESFEKISRLLLFSFVKGMLGNGKFFY